MVNTTLRAYLDELNLLLEQEALEEVIGHCRHILQHFPKNVETYRLLGRALLEKGRYEEAGDVFQRVLSALPDDFVSHLGLSGVAEERGDVPIAIWHLERAYEQEPNNMALQGELKRLYERRDGSAPDRIQLTPSALVRIYAKGRLYEQAVGELRTALQQTPDRVDLLVLHADILWNNDRPVEAGEVALRILEKMPNSIEANQLLASLWLKSGRPSEAHPFISRLEQLDPFLAWTTVQPDGKELPSSAFQLPRLDWDARAAAALATDVPDWVSAISNVFEAPESVPLTGSVTNWLEDAGPTRTSPAPAANEPFEMPDWMSDSAPAATSASSAASSGDEAPDWFKDSASGVSDTESIGGAALPEWFEEELPAPTQAAQASGIEASWLDDEPGATPEDQLPSGFTDLLMGSSLSQPASLEAEPAVDIPSWMDEPVETSEAAPEPAPTLDAMSWLSTGPLTPLEGEPVSSEASGADVAESAADSGLDWLSSMPSGEPPSSAEPLPTADAGLDWLSSMPSSEPSPAEPAQADTGLDWLSSMPSTEESAATPAGSGEDVFELRGKMQGSEDWPGSEPVQEEQPVSESDPMAWLRPYIDSEGTAAEPTGAEDVASVGDNGFGGEYGEEDTAIQSETPDWLSSIRPSLDRPAAAQTPLEELDFGAIGGSTQPEAEDWLASLGEAQAPEAKPKDTGSLAWLSQPASEPAAEPTVELEEDWLASFEAGVTPSAGAPVESPSQPAQRESETADWFASQSIEQSIEQSSEQSIEQPADVEPAPTQEDWLGSLGFSQPAEETSTADEAPAWMQEEPVSQENGDLAASETKGHFDSLLKHAAERTDQPRMVGDTGVLDPGKLPDWMSAFGGEVPEETTAEPAVQQTAQAEPDWLAEDALTGSSEVVEEAAPDAGSVPSWLSEMAPASQASTAATPIDQLDFGSLEATEQPAGEAPDWLSSVMTPSSQASTAATPIDELDFDSLEASWSGGSKASEGTPLEPFAQSADLVDTGMGTGDKQPEAASSFSFDRRPAWMRKKNASPKAPGEDVPDWLKNPADSSASKGGSKDKDLPDWLRE